MIVLFQMVLFAFKNPAYWGEEGFAYWPELYSAREINGEFAKL